MMNILLFGLWFFFPAGCANVTPILAAKMPFLSNLGYPVDGYKRIGNVRILGDHKTWRGVITGVIIGTLVSVAQAHVVSKYPGFFPFIPVAYRFQNPLFMGLLLSFGALCGDIVKSYFKRQFSIASGKSWLGFDQIDYVLGGVLFSLFYILYPLQVYAVIIIEWVIIHVVASGIGYILSLKKAPI